MRNDEHLQSHRPVRSPVRQMTLAVSAILLLVAAGYAGFFIHNEQQEVRIQAEEQGHVLARGYAALGATPLFDNLFMLQSAFIQIKNQHDIKRIMLLDPDGMVVASDVTTLIGTILNDQATRNAELQQKGVAFSGLEVGFSDDTIVIFEPVYQDPLYRTGTENAGERGHERAPKFAGWIRVEISLGRLQTEAWQSLGQQILTMTFLVVVTILAVGKTIRRLSRNLENSEDQLRKMIDTALDAVVTVDAGGAIVSWNIQAETIFGWSEQEVIGEPIESIILPSRYRDAHRQELARFRESKETSLLNRRVELTAVRRDGTEFPAEWSTTAISINGGYVLSSFIRDITERKQAEEAQRKYRAQLELEAVMRTETLKALEGAKNLAESASKAKSEFLAHISHEIRTPMNGILGMTELLRQTQLSSKQEHFVETVYRSGGALLKLLNDVLDLSKAEAGKIELERIQFDLTSTVKEVVDIFVDQAQSKGVKLNYMVAESIPAVLLGDPARLQQVLMNLLANAVKFTERGSITLRAALEEGSASHLIVRFEVQDTGIGVAPAAHAKIFEAFSQADGTMARKFGGTGLGLSIVKQLILLMEGEVGVRSEVGQGAVFWCTARFAKVSGSVGETVKSFSTSRRGIMPHVPAQLPDPRVVDARILLAEDNPVNREVAVCMLEQLGCHVVAVEHGREAVTKMESSRFDVVLMDCQMPEMDGFAATRVIREGEQRTGSRVPIIALTAQNIDNHRERCLAAGMDDYMSKPFTQVQLGEIVQRWIRRPGDTTSLSSDQSKTVQAESAQSSSDRMEQRAPRQPVLAPFDMPLVDQVLAPIRALRRPGRPDPVAQILTSFLDSSATYIGAIHQAMSYQDALALFHAAHALKSSSAMIGAMRLSGILKDIESMGRQGNVPGVQTRMAELDTAYEAVKQAVLNELGKKTA
jgi:PAS domain S-box-containing protein